MKIYVCLSLCVTVASLLSCKKNEKTKATAPPFEEKSTKNNIEKSESDSAKTPKVEYVKQFEPYLDRSIAEGWNVEKWKKQFGEPIRHDQLGDGSVILDYEDMGEHSSIASELNTAKLITGVSIFLRSDKTYRWNWRITKFGMPDWLKEQMQKNQSHPTGNHDIEK